MPLKRQSQGQDGSAPPQSDQARILSSDTPDERWSAARRLAAEPESAGLLAEALGREQDSRVREAIFTALAHIGGDQAASIVLPYIRDPDAAVRNQALDSLCAMPAAVSSHLPALLSDSDPDVRLLACEIVRQLPPTAATALLCGLLDNETELNVCAAVVEVLAEVGEPSALPFLAVCAKRFSDVSFLAFAIEIAATRISSGASDARPA